MPNSILTFSYSGRYIRKLWSISYIRSFGNMGGPSFHLLYIKTSNILLLLANQLFVFDSPFHAQLLLLREALVRIKEMDIKVISCFDARKSGVTV